MSESHPNAAIRFERDGYDMSGERLMGRQSAGSGFLRAAVAARGDGSVTGYGPRSETAVDFAALASSIDPTAQTQWIRADQLARFGPLGVCYRPDPVIGPEARLRLRVGPAHHSLCGVTHTLSTSGTADALADYLVAPLAPWDALICTSAAALGVVSNIFEAQAAYLSWRLGAKAAPLAPQLPVIPLGVHCDDFVFSADHRRAARQSLGLADDEAAVLYAGRLSFSDKAHPLAMYRALQAVAERTGRKPALILAGKFLNEVARETYEVGLAGLCPDVRSIFVDGADASAYRDAWAGADVFVSMADSIQETFGLTPIEAMAAGIPSIVSDWNGYRDTVRDGVDGFRIRTWTLPPGAGDSLALALDSEVFGQGRFAWAASAVTAIDLGQMIDRLHDLISDPDLRRRMGAAARLRAREAFDWSGIYRSYQALWGELNARRHAAMGDANLMAHLRAAPRAAASRGDPFKTFGAYPTGHVTSSTRLLPVADASLARYGQLLALFPEAGLAEPMVAALLARLDAGPLTAGEAAQVLNCPPGLAIRLAATLAKMDLVRLEPPTP